jgi:NDP-sugar pyrophosphorylase family protein
LVSCAVVIAVGNIAHQSQLIYNRPRAMLPALGKPLVVRIMDRLYRAGIQKFMVVVGEDEGAVAAYLNTASRICTLLNDSSKRTSATRKTRCC